MNLPPAAIAQPVKNQSRPKEKTCLIVTWRVEFCKMLCGEGILPLSRAGILPVLQCLDTSTQQGAQS